MTLIQIRKIVLEKLERLLMLIDTTEDESKKMYFIRCYDSIVESINHCDKQEFMLWFWGMLEKSITKAQLKTLQKDIEFLPILH